MRKVEKAMINDDVRRSTSFSLLTSSSLREFVKMEHRLVLAVLAKERDVLAEIHIL